MLWFGIAILALAAGILFLWFENNVLQVSHYILRESIKDKVRIIHLSDLHDKSFGKQNEKLIRRIRLLHPDIICYTGDLNRRRSPGHYHNGVRLLQVLCSIAPTVYAFGNHEVMGEECELIRDAIKDSDVLLLQNQSADLTIRGVHLSILGLDAAERKPAFVELQVERFLTENSGYRIVLCHFPHYFSDLEHISLSLYPVDLILSGHAHGGQIRLFGHGLFAPEQGVLPKYTAGMHQESKSRMVISRGLGGSIFPFRLWNRPEIGIIDLLPL